MLFKQCKFKDKAKVRKQMKDQIISNIKNEIPYNQINTGRLFEYIDILLDDSDYDIRGEQFYYHHRWVKIVLDAELLSKVVSEYVNEHLNEFILEKNK